MHEVLVFQVESSRGSRARESRVISRANNTHKLHSVRLKNGMTFRPSRPERVEKETLLRFADEFVDFERRGLLIVRINGRVINMQQALELCRGERHAEQPPFNSASYVVDPQQLVNAPSGADMTLVRLERAPLPQEPEIVIETADVDGVPSVSLSPTEVDLSSMAGLEFVIESQPTKQSTKHSKTEEVALLTVQEAASLLGKSVSWVRKKIKDGSLVPVSSDPYMLSLEQVRPLMVSVDEPGVDTETPSVE